MPCGLFPTAPENSPPVSSQASPLEITIFGSVVLSPQIDDARTFYLQFQATRYVMTRYVLILSFLVWGLATSQSVLAHHSEVAEYDPEKPVKVTGTISKVEWQNPHVWFYVDVKDEQGKVTTWGFSTAPPGALLRRGVTKDALKIGAVVNVQGSRARDGSSNASGRSVTFADGRNVLMAGEDAR